MIPAYNFAANCAQHLLANKMQILMVGCGLHLHSLAQEVKAILWERKSLITEVFCVNPDPSGAEEISAVLNSLSFVAQVTSNAELFFCEPSNLSFGNPCHSTPQNGTSTNAAR